jgi:hypothetical protein
MACDHPICEVWHISYRSGSSVITNIFENKDLAIDASRRLLDIGSGDEIEAGLMLKSLEDSVLNIDDIGEIDYDKEQEPSGTVLRHGNIRTAEPRAGRVERLQRLARLLALRTSQWFRRMPWQCVWIIALAILLLILTLFCILHKCWVIVSLIPGTRTNPDR